MISPFIPEDLLEIGNYHVVYNDDKMVIIDNWYKNYDTLYELLQNIHLPRWKWSENGRNFIDYYDCRPIINCNYPEISKIKKYFDELSYLILKYFPNNSRIVDQSVLMTELLEFNFYKNIKENIEKKYQHYPHVDYNYNCIVYLDKICSGGTALYPEMTNCDLIGAESENLLFDISKQKLILIPSVPNRMTIFNGKIFHGGYIEDHNSYIKDWRINQVTLIK